MTLISCLSSIVGKRHADDLGRRLPTNLDFSSATHVDAQGIASGPKPQGLRRSHERLISSRVQQQPIEQQVGVTDFLAQTIRVCERFLVI